MEIQKIFFLEKLGFFPECFWVKGILGILREKGLYVKIEKKFFRKKLEFFPELFLYIVVMKYLKTYEQSNLVTKLDYSNDNLTELPELPYGLKELYCNTNNLTELPELPEGLEILYCNNNKLSELPELPYGLKELYCNTNKLRELPELPYGLKELYCYNNKLSELPELPYGLNEFYCNNNKLPFIDLDEYKEWYKENKHIIEKKGLSYAYKLSHSVKDFNI